MITSLHHRKQLFVACIVLASVIGITVLIVLESQSARRAFELGRLNHPADVSLTLPRISQLDGFVPLNSEQRIYVYTADPGATGPVVMWLVFKNGVADDNTTPFFGGRIISHPWDDHVSVSDDGVVTVTYFNAARERSIDRFHVVDGACVPLNDS